MRSTWLLLLSGAVLTALWACHDPDAALPETYRTAAVPGEVTNGSQRARDSGRALYLAHCALCHGVRADGQGVRRTSLSSSPVDFTRQSWCREATPRRVYFAVREGVSGTAMPSWKALTEAQCWDLVAYLLSVCRQSS